MNPLEKIARKMEERPIPGCNVYRAHNGEITLSFGLPPEYRNTPPIFPMPALLDD